MKKSRGGGRWIFMLIFCVCLFIPIFTPYTVHARAPYWTFSENSYGDWIFTQNPYHPDKFMAHDIHIPNPDNPNEQVHSPLNQPQDLFIAGNDEMYIADTGNHRIVHLDAEGQLVNIISFSDHPLKNPEGVFVDAEGYIYIADTGNRRIVVTDPGGKWIREHHRPDSKYIPPGYSFEPVKLVVDARGFMYIASKGSFQGLMLMDPKGEFHGFFGANGTETTLFDRIKLLIYSEQQLSRQARLLPRVPRNVAIDDTGFIYTTTFGARKEEVKKFNIRSENVLEDIQFGTFYTLNSTIADSQIVDIAIDSHQNIFTVDRERNNVNIFNAQGEFLFTWIGSVTAGQSRLGLVHTPSAVAVNSQNDLFVLDEGGNNIQKFKLSYFGKLVLEGMNMMNDGRYQESVETFNEVIRLNAHFSPAYKGLGLAAYHRGDYHEALRYFKIAGDKQGYSDALWQIRLKGFQERFSFMANSFLVIGAVGVTGRTVMKRYKLRFRRRRFKKEFRLLTQLKHSLFILRHPLEGFSDLRYDRKGSYISAFILLLLAVMSYLIHYYYTAFPFTPDLNISEVKTSEALLPVFGAWLSWVVCNYLISSIYRGEGRFADVFIGSAYALTPLILLGVPITILSHGLTLAEASIYEFFYGVMMIWMAALLFWKVQALQNYSVAETIVNILLTLVAMVILWVLAFIVFGLAIDLYEFIYALYQEVTMR
ncbi:YIP1 family protein [Paenibacillus tarimensis]